MKSTLNEIKASMFPFPKLMCADGGLVVLMQYDGTGVVVAEDEDGEYFLGYYGEWDMILFKDYMGSVTLQN